MARRRAAIPEPEQPETPPLADVLALLAAGEPLAGLPAAIAHALTLAAHGPAAARELEEVLRGRVIDARPLDAARAWLGTVGRAAQEAHATVLVAALAVGRAGAREEGPAPGWVREALDEVLLAALGRDDGDDRDGHAAHLAAVASTWARTRLVAELDVAAALVALLEDRGRPPRVRWGARLTLEALLRPKSSREATALGAAADRHVEQLLGDRAEPEELRTLALASAHRLLPDLDVEDLQRRGLVASLPLPPNTVQDHALRPLFDEVDRDQLRRVLDQGDEGPLLTTALALVPHLVLRWPVRWRDWEPRVRALIGRVPAAASAYAGLLPALGPWKAELRPHLVEALRRGFSGAWARQLAAATRRLYGPEEPLEEVAQLFVDAVRGAPALPWEHRLACYSVLVECWGELATCGDEALADVLEATRDELAFWQGLALLARRRRDLIVQRVDSGALSRRPLPPVEVLHAAGGNQYDGFYCDVVADRVKGVAALVEPAHVLACVERLDDVGRACAAMHVLPLLVERDPAFARRAEEAAVALVTDTRVHRGSVESTGQRAGCRSEAFPLAPAARELTLTLAARADASRQAELALACLARVLAPEHVAKAHDSDVKDLLSSWSARPGIALATWAALGRSLVEAVADRGRGAPVRLRAYEALRHAARRTGLAATLEPELRRATAVLVASLRTPRDEDPALVAYVRTNLAAIDPGAVAALQGQGHIAVEGVPSLAELLGPASSATARSSDSTRVRLAGVAVRPEQVVLALGGREPDGVLAALLLVPEVASRASWKELANALLPHASAAGFSPRVMDGESVAKLATARLVAVVDLPARAGDPTARGHLLEVLRRIVGADPGTFRGEVEQCIDACVKTLAGCPPAADLLDLVRPWLRDRARSTTVRFRALRLLLAQGDAVAKELLLALLHDAKEDPALRALAGTIAWNHARKELEALVNTRTRPWTLAARRGSRLPISEPADVPTDWVIASLLAAGDQPTRRGALWKLERRFSVKDDLPRGSHQLRQAAARHRGLAAALRAELDRSLEETWDYQARQAGQLVAQLLALLGRAQDTGRVARAALRCSWHVPCGDCGASHETPAEQVSGDGRSALDPHMAVGFGPGADRVRARAWVELGRSHLASGRRAEAVDALRAALELAPGSREIARELRAARA